MPKRILIVGASGFLGRTLLHRLHGAGHQVTACVRRAKHYRPVKSTIRVVEADYTTHTAVDQWLPLVQGYDVVINAVGIIREQGANSFAQLHTHGPIALFDAAISAGVEKVIQISALGSDATAVTPFHLTKRYADDHLAATACEWLILRPSLIYGNGCKSATLFKAIAALPLIPVAGSGNQPIQPVAVEDVVRIVHSFIEGTIKPQQRIDVVGPGVMTVREMLSRYRHWLGLGTARFVTIPERLSLWLAHRFGLFGIAAPSDATRALLKRGNTADATALSDQTGITPLAMDEALLQTPAQPPDRWHARLYSLHPLLRMALGLMWIWTALVSAGLYSIEKSMALLAAVGLSGTAALAALISATLLDLLLGLALLLRYQVKAAAWLQIAAITAYSLIIAVALPEFLLHPFGPLIKNLPLIVATLMLIAMEE